MVARRVSLSSVSNVQCTLRKTVNIFSGRKQVFDQLSTHFIIETLSIDDGNGNDDGETEERLRRGRGCVAKFEAIRQAQYDDNFPQRGSRTVPTIVTAHRVCASGHTRVSYGWCLLLQGYFCALQNYAEKTELSK